MKINEVLSPLSGVFSNMPQTIWGSNLDPSLLDIEVFTRIGELEVAPLGRFYITDGILDTHKLSTILYQKYSNNWQRMWDALKIEYDLRLTSSTKEHREVHRTVDDTENSNNSGKNTEGGTESATKTSSNLSDVSDDISYLGSENRSGSDNEDRALASTDGGTRINANTTTDSGTVHTGSTGSTGGTGSLTIANSRAGSGGVGTTLVDSTVNSETRNFTNTDDKGETRALAGSADNTETLDLTKGDTGSVDHTTTDNLSYTDRADIKSVRGVGNTNDNNDVNFGKTVVDISTGMVGTANTESNIEDFTSEGSTPLRTYQALITEEIVGRSGESWNFTDLVIKDVQSMIASSIWSRERV